MLGVSVASAQETAALRSIQVTDADGKVRSGNLAELGSGQLAMGTPDAMKFVTRNLVLLKFKDRTASLAPGDPLVVLSNGEVLAVHTDTITDESLAGRWARAPELPALRVPLDAVRGMIFVRPAHSTGLARLLDLMLDGGEAHDTVILANGDAVTGDLTGLTEKELVLATKAGNSTIDRDGVLAVVLNSTLASSEPMRGEGALVSLTDGSRFRARDLKFIAPDQLALHPHFGGNLSIPLAGVESLRFLGGCVTYLSDLTPLTYQFEPFFEIDWPLRRDRAVAGSFLKLRGAEYPKGLGMHSRSTVTYRLDGKFRRFHSMVGIDDVTAGKGSIVVEVLLDGKIAYQSGPLTGVTPAVAIDRVDVSAARSLSLRVEFAGDGDIQDHADWCDAMIVK